MKKSFACLCAVLMLSGFSATAADMDPETIKKQHPEAWQAIYDAGRAEAQAESRPAPDWWNHSSRSAAGTADSLKKHLEIDYSYIHLQGNDEGNVHKGRAQAVLRKGYLTNITTYTIDRVDIEQSSGGKTKTDTHFFENYLQWDFTKRVYGQTGYIWERDLTTYVENRHIGYIGAGATVLQTGPFKLDLYLAGGYQDENYYRIINQLIGMRSQSTPIIYALQSFSWQITDHLRFTQKWRGIYDTEKSGEFIEVMTAQGPAYPKVDKENRLRQRFKMELAYSLSKHISVFTNILLDHDTTPWPGVEKTDVKNANGLRLLF